MVGKFVSASLKALPYHCPLIVHNKGNGWTMIEQFKQGREIFVSEDGNY
jgi:hypothetical protein